MLLLPCNCEIQQTGCIHQKKVGALVPCRGCCGTDGDWNKYFILKVDPKKRILFDPQASVDFQGNTGPFIQYTYARIQAILRKSSPESQPEVPKSYVLHNKEKSLLKQLQLFPDVVQQAAANYSPALVANFSYDLVKEFNSFYQNVSILGADSAVEISFRVQLSKAVADTVKNAFSLLGIKVPERM